MCVYSWRAVSPTTYLLGSRPGSDALYSLGLTVWRGGRVGRRQPPAKRLQGQNLCPGLESVHLRQTRPELSWIERRTTNPKARGSTPLGRTIAGRGADQRPPAHDQCDE